MVGFVVFSVPTTDYYTRHYLTLTIVVWAITFSMVVLFLPKLHTFFFRKGNNNQTGKRPDISGRVRTDKTVSTHSVGGDTETKSRELMSINRFLASPNAINPELIMAQQSQKSTDFSSASDNISNASTVKNNVSTTIFEAHEVCMTIYIY